MPLPHVPSPLTQRSLQQPAAVEFDQAREAIAAQEWTRARTILEPLIGTDHDAVARNNLALVYWHEGDASKAYSFLEPNLAGRGPQPFAHATAARYLLAAGGDEPTVRKHILQAADDLDAGLTALKTVMSLPDAAWREYTVAVLLSAGALEDDGLVWDLYQRWLPVHNHPEAHYLGGVAAFNRRRWTAAGRTWARIEDPSWSAAVAFADVLPFLESGVVPAYRLPYTVPDFSEWLASEPDGGFIRLVRICDQQPEDLADDDMRFAEQAVTEDLHWTLLLIWVLGDSQDVPLTVKSHLLTAMVRFGAGRGEALAHSLFMANAVPIELKTAAAFGLLQSGRLENGTEVPMLISGKTRAIRISRSPLITNDEGLDARYKEAIAARDRGDKALARSILEPVAELDGPMHVPSLVAYANLVREQGEFGKAHRLFDLLSKAFPEEPSLLFNQAALALQVMDPNEARALIDRALALSAVDPELRAMMTKLRQQTDVVQQMVDMMKDLTRGTEPEAFLERPVRIDAGLRQALSLLPVRWLDAACDLHLQERPSGGRKEREADLLAALLRDPATAVHRAVDTDPRGHLEDVLGYLQAMGGWAPRDAVVRRFGSDAHDRIRAADGRAYTTLGHARLSCLVFGGTARVRSTPEVIIGIPMELRDACADIAGLHAALRPEGDRPVR